MQSHRARIATFAFLHNEDKNKLSSLAAAREGFYFTVSNTLSCYRCLFFIKLSDLYSHQQSSELIKSHTLTKCTKHMKSRDVLYQEQKLHSDNINQQINETDNSQATVNNNQQVQFSRDDTSLSESTTTKTPHMKFNKKMISYVAGLGFERAFIDYALRKMDKNIVFHTILQVANCLIHFNSQPLLPGEKDLVNIYKHRYCRSDETEQINKRKHKTKYEKFKEKIRQGQIKRPRKPKKRDPPQPTPAELELMQEISDLQDEYLCKVCVSQICDCVLLPCGHLICITCCLCVHNCPVCRAKILAHVTINTT